MFERWVFESSGCSASLPVERDGAEGVNGGDGSFSVTIKGKCLLRVGL